MDFKPDLKNILDQAQKMQKSMQDAQTELASMTVIGKSGIDNAEVKVHMSGRHQAKKVEIDYSLMDEDKDVLEDLIVAAINDAAHKIEGESQKRISDLTAGLQMPEGFNLPKEG